jgi:muramoyltetrapeptide carboxypeptidase
VNEAPYKVDRMLSQLLRAGCLAGVRGIALGQFLNCAPPPGSSYTLTQVLRERLEPLGVPILADLPVGHGPQNHPISLGPAQLFGNRLLPN